LNDNYLIETTVGKYFIKGIRGKVAHRLGYISQVEVFMRNSHIPAVCMMKDEDDVTIFVHNDISYTVYPFVESDRSHEYTDNDYIKMGELLGKIHRVDSMDLPEDLKTHTFKISNQQNKLEIINGYRELILTKESKDEVDELFLNYINLKIKAFEKLKDVNFVENDALIHGDYHAGNLLFDKDSREIIGICDWEKSEYAPRAYEFARSLLYICFSLGFDDNQAFKDSEKFIQGYVSQIPIDKDFLIQGLNLRLRQIALSNWLEDKYYKENNSLTNRFIENEMNHLNLFVFGNGIKILENFTQHQY
jgi:Ser/Thr protein kinase RdoA (MazF antagonist)